MAKVFISWSGDVSLEVAKALYEWLPGVLQAVRPWMSTDIAAGAHWSTVLRDQLSESEVGIICLTRDNLTAPWLLFEAGALAKHLNLAKVVPFRFQLETKDVTPPLSEFQSVSSDDELGMLHLLNTLNGVVDRPLKDEQLNTAFRIFWPMLKTRFLNIAKQVEERRNLLTKWEKDLVAYPRAPAIDATFIPHSFIQKVADKLHDRNAILDLVASANALRQRVDPDDPRVTIIRNGLLVLNDTAYAAWLSVFDEARLNSPRMLAAMLMVLPLGADALDEQRNQLLSALRTIHSAAN